MPLLKGKSNLGANLKELTSEGKSRKQSLAIALSVAKEGKRPGSKLKKVYA